MKTRFLILIAAAVIVLGACKKSENYDNTTTSTTDTTYTDTSATTTTTGTGATGGTTSPLSNEDKDFAMKAAQGNMSEVSLGSVAAQKGTSPDVKTFGNRMVNDHGKALDELKQLALTKGISLPTEVSAEQKLTADKLSKYSGKQFDKASKNAQDPDLKAWAAKTLPVIQDHFKMAQDLKSKVK